MQAPSPIHAAVALILIGAAVAVRAVPASDAAPGPEADAAAAVAEPMQLLQAGGALRLHELDVLLQDERRGAWIVARRSVTELAGCPETAEWLASAPGQRTERLVSELSTGSADEAFCALALLYQLARRTAWSPGVFGGSEDAERLGALLFGWLSRWAEPSERDPLLREPALATFLVYGAVMHEAASGGAFSSSPASLARARAALRELVGESGRRMTSFGAGVASRYPAAFEAALRDDGDLAAIAREAALWFPSLDGACGG